MKNKMIFVTRNNLLRWIMFFLSMFISLTFLFIVTFAKRVFLPDGNVNLIKELFVGVFSNNAVITLSISLSIAALFQAFTKGKTWAIALGIVLSVITFLCVIAYTGMTFINEMKEMSTGLTWLKDLSDNVIWLNIGFLIIAFGLGSIAFIPSKEPVEYIQVQQDRVHLHLIYSSDGSTRKHVRTWMRKNTDE